MRRGVTYHNGSKSINKIGSGDSYYISKFIKSDAERKDIFRNLLDEVEFEQMFNISPNNAVYPLPRLVAAQTDCTLDESTESTPIYRMPGCNECNIQTKPWSKTVKYVRDLASKLIGQEFNHCVIGLFRDQNDSLAYHKDKLLDLEEDSVIISVSFGEDRPIYFKSEKDSSEEIINLKAGSLLAFGQKTNHQFKHTIPKLDEPVGARISLSFRTVATKCVKNIETNTFEIIGQGTEHQTVNYPFIKSFDPKLDKTIYTEDMLKQIDEFKQLAKIQLEEIKNLANETRQHS